MMNSILIQERPCPRCGNRRTARLGRSTMSVCFNCNLRWDGSEAASYPTTQPLLSDLFTESALQRLETYRTAIRSGFYTDWSS